MTTFWRSVETSLLLAALALPAVASAQASGGASGDIELGANQASEIEMSAGSSGSADRDGDGDADGPSRHSVRDGDNGARLGIQVRLDAVNVLRFAEPDEISASIGQRLLVPIVAPGVRLLDGTLFLGLGFGFAGYDGPQGPGEEFSRSGFSLTPLASFDLLSDEYAALSLLGALNIGSFGESEMCGPGGPGGGQTCVQNDDDAFGFGLTLGAGIRGMITKGLALGGEFGWGFLSIASDPAADTFIHGIFGNLTLEASVGI